VLVLLLGLSPFLANAQNPAVTIYVDTSVNRRPINTNIYGVAYATTALFRSFNHRNGGNNTTRYNWQLNLFEYRGCQDAALGENVVGLSEILIGPSSVE
jgi:hypothetical protein